MSDFILVNLRNCFMSVSSSPKYQGSVCQRRLLFPTLAIDADPQFLYVEVVLGSSDWILWAI